MADPTTTDQRHGRADRRRGGRSGQSAAALRLAQSPKRRSKLPFPPVDLLSVDQIESIHETSLEVLREVGMEVMLPEARDRLKAAGAEVRDSRVTFPRELVESALRTAPSRFVLHARNPANDLGVGGASINFGTVASAPNCSDLEGGRRTGTFADFENFLKLAQIFNCIDFVSGYPVEPIDLHPSIRHLDALQAMAVMTDKPFHAYSLGRERITDGIEIARIARGISADQLEREPSLFSIINTNSPLKLDVPMLQALSRCRRRTRSSASRRSPRRCHGAGHPRRRAGRAECRGAGRSGDDAGGAQGRALHLWRLHLNVDMKSGAPAFGTPEYMKAAIIGGQLARRYGLPYRTSNTCAANAVDAQSAYESVFSLWGAVMGGGNIVLHGAGWMEGGLVASFEKFVLDCDLIQMVEAFLAPLAVDSEALGLDAIREVGPGGHFFGAAHTLARYEHAFMRRSSPTGGTSSNGWRPAGPRRTRRRTSSIARRSPNMKRRRSTRWSPRSSQPSSGSARRRAACRRI